MDFLMHFSNCHGEWQFVAGALTSIPFLGLYIKRWRARHACDKHNRDTPLAVGEQRDG